MYNNFPNAMTRDVKCLKKIDCARNKFTTRVWPSGSHISRLSCNQGIKTHMPLWLLIFHFASQALIICVLRNHSLIDPPYYKYLNKNVKYNCAFVIGCLG